LASSQDPLLDDGQLVGHQGLDAGIEGACLASRIDPRLNQPQEFIEDGVLERDGQRQNTVEPALDRRAMVEMKRRSPRQSVVTGRNTGADA
jgi:hypothetical protein